jgi:hypothetical protein
MLETTMGQKGSILVKNKSDQNETRNISMDRER